MGIMSNQFDKLTRLMSSNVQLLEQAPKTLTDYVYGQLREDIIQGKSADHALIASGFAIDPFTGDKDILLTDPGTGDICKNI